MFNFIDDGKGNIKYYNGDKLIGEGGYTTTETEVTVDMPIFNGDVVITHELQVFLGEVRLHKFKELQRAYNEAHPNNNASAEISFNIEVDLGDGKIIKDKI